MRGKVKKRKLKTGWKKGRERADGTARVSEKARPVKTQSKEHDMGELAIKKEGERAREGEKVEGEKRAEGGMEGRARWVTELESGVAVTARGKTNSAREGRTREGAAGNR